MQKRICVPKCVHHLWNGPKGFNVLPALRAANIPVTEFDTHWGVKVKSLRTDKDKRAFVEMLKQGGVGDGNLLSLGRCLPTPGVSYLAVTQL